MPISSCVPCSRCEQAAQVLTERTRELADANAELRAGLDARERTAQVLTDRTQELETAQARLSVTAEFVSTLNQEGMIEAYRGHSRCLARATEVPLAVIYDAGNGGRFGPPVVAVGPDHQPLNAAMFAGNGLPATVGRTSEIQTLFGPFEASGIADPFRPGRRRAAFGHRAGPSFTWADALGRGDGPHVRPRSGTADVRQVLVSRNWRSG